MAKNYKYSNLPNIALDQTDVYETSGEPEEVEQQTSSGDKKLTNLNSSKFIKQEFNQSIFEQVDLSNDNIDTINIKAKDAYNKFKDKYLPTACYSESQLTCQKFGEWELINKSSRSEETVYQRYCRLKNEVSELSNQLSCVDESKVTSNKFQSDLNPSDILSNLNLLETQLNSLKIDDKKENALFGLEIYQDIEKKLNETKDDTIDQTKSDKVTYQLFCNPNLSKLNDLTKAQKLEQRIKNLENILGNDQDELEKIPTYSNGKSVVDAVNTLSSKVAQLDANHLEQIDSRLTSLLHKFNQLNDKKNELIEIEKQNKINDLYELVDKSNQNLDAVPAILTRLNNLEGLQQQAIHFSDALTYLDTLQSQVHNSLQSNEEELKALKEIFGQNIESIKSLLSQWDKKMSKN